MAVLRLPRLLVLPYFLGIHFVLGIAVWRSEKFASVGRHLFGTSSEEARPASHEVMRRFHLIQNGNPEDEFHNGDGLHLNSTGNEAWINELRRILEAIPTVPAQ